MSQRLKRWESPRREGRNDKGKGGSARQRQKLKQLKGLRQKLKRQADQHQGQQKRGERAQVLSPLLLSPSF
ncbi:MAG: hypothetical protein HC840_14295 [Leptolyngbyaceae cyanobacterium RM2_2_4]|nr:hypothetical protein [Leptolyngbyaceae cyanobacterium SM1_4_3]NJN58797.1 hypothetical protein [Leptolyngbyaceae cyanobacterium SL_5_9]NJO50407.1 hypothetical protein [Leptolyngbyaceae cyanobacterium RM2_2_4]NJO66799.1 hypothetical protein [Leptolyngbyaceae cyanobacterium RM1_405_57]